MTRILGLVVLLVVFLTAAACPIAAPRTPALHTHPLTPAPAVISETGADIVTLVNEQRVAAGCEALVVNGSMVAFAENHARWMDNGGGFVHSTLGPPILAENLSQGILEPTEIIDVWMDSATHKENILNCTYTDTGVGVSGEFIVQVFGDDAA